MAYQDEVLADAPSGYWRMNETSGGTAFDSSGNNWGGLYNGGCVLNQPTMVGGGVSMYFNGAAGTYVGVTDNAALFGTASITVECWVYPSAPLNSGSFVNRRNASNVGGFTLEANPNGTQFFANVGGTWYAVNGPRVTLWAWNHVVGVFTNGRHELWLNGRLFTLPTPGTLNNPAGAILEFGRNVGNPALCYTGRMDEVAIYPTALSATRILAHYNAGKIAYPPAYTAIMQDAPVGYWRLDEPSGTVANDSSGYFVSGTYTGPVSLNQPGPLLTEPAGVAVSFPKNGGGYVSIPQSGNLNTPSGWSVECWAYMRSYGATGESPTFFTSLYPGGDSSGHIPVVLAFDYAAGGEQKVFVGYHHGTLGWTKCVQNGVFPLSKWTHVAGVFTGSSLALYLDGVLNATLATTIANPMPTASPRYIGRRWDQGVQNPDAVLDEVVLYNKALGGDRIAAHYLGGVNRYDSEVMFDGPQALWRLDEYSGTVAVDSSGYGRHATYAGTGHGYNYASFMPNVPGSIAHYVNNSGFNATGPWIDCGYGAPFAGPPAQFSLEAWVWANNPLNQNEGGQIMGCHNNANRGYGMLMDARAGSGQPFKIHFRMRDGLQVVQGVVGYALNAWHHIVCTYDGVTYRIFGDGVLDTSAVVAQTPGDCTVDNHFGLAHCALGWGGPAGYRALIDEAAFYTVALPPSRVADHYRVGREVTNAVKRWDSTLAAWRPVGIARWDGTSWVTVAAKRWDGAAWV